MVLICNHVDCENVFWEFHLFTSLFFKQFVYLREQAAHEGLLPATKSQGTGSTSS